MKKIICIVAAALAMNAAAETYNLTVDAGKPGAPIQPTMYGLFFEDINFAADGGLYAEKIKNRSFEFPQNLMGWKTFGGVELRNDGPFERNPHYVRLTTAGHKHKHTGLENEGFVGIGVEKGKSYRFSVWARVPDSDSIARLKVVLADRNTHGRSQDLASANFKVTSSDWQKYTVELKPDATCAHAVLRVFLRHPDSIAVDLEHLSLFPVDTWKKHENGLRKDLVQKLADLKPGVFRFPGGCIVEGTDLDSRYQWKNTVGPVENRPTIENRWHYTFTNHFFPDYFQSNGLGFYEYFLLSEELEAEPLPVLNVGLVCQYQNEDEEAHVPVDALQPFIQDALDLVEFANGDTTTTWGAVRAQMGHPAPFNLKVMGIGNEQWGPEYVKRLEPFLTAMRKAHPEIKIVGSSGPDSEGDEFEYLWPEMERVKVDLVDEHFYRPGKWFLSQAKRYDIYDRKGPKVFAGEYACHMKNKNWNHFEPALLEAAFMTGLERNADVVHMATYAPLFAHVDAWQWRPDMIWFDNLRSMPTSSYYVQQMYATNKGSNVLPITLNGRPVAGEKGQHGLYASATLDTETNQIIIKLVNTSKKNEKINIDITGLKKGQTLDGGKAIILTADLEAENTLDEPDIVEPIETRVLASGTRFETEITSSTFAVYRLNLK